MITIYIPGLALKSYEYRRGDAQIIHDDKNNAIVIDGGETDLYNKLIAYCRNKKITHVTCILTHWHIDHDTGLKAFLDVSGICVDRIYCPPPGELAGLQEPGASDDRARANRRISQAQSLGKPIVYPPAGKFTDVRVGDVYCKIWRRSARKSDQNDREINNTSMQTYFPDLYYLTGGDMIDKGDFLKTRPGTVKVMKGYHHGNGDGQADLQTIKGWGVQLYWYNDFEPKGSAIGSTNFSKWGAGKAKGIIQSVIRTDSDIVMTAANHVLKVQKGSSIWTFQIPYDGKGGEGWYKGDKGTWYQFADGSYAVGWNELPWTGGKDWFYFGENGIMLTGWYFDKGFQKWYYLDPSTGVMQKNKAINVSGLWYFLDGYGQMRTGWYEEPDIGLHYLEPDSGKNMGHMYVSCQATIDGKLYSFDGYGRASEIVAATDAVELVIQIAKNEVGYKEKASNKNLDDKTANAGSANYTKYGRDMHSVYPKTMDFPAAWCDAFVDWCFYKAFGKDIAPQMLCGTFDDYTVNSAGFYKKTGRWFTVPAVGDQVFFKDSNGICHTGLVYRLSGGKVYTIEGNSSNEVRYCEYAESNNKIAGYGRPRWELASQGAPVRKSIDEVAREVIAGKWGVGDIRKQLLTENGYDYAAVQAKVNEILKQ